MASTSSRATVFKLHQEFVDDPQNDVLIQGGEADDAVETIPELRRKHSLDVDHFVTFFLLVGETDGRFLQTFRPRVGRHDDDDVTEISLAAIIVRQSTVIHDLQEDTENVRVGFFNFIEQQNRMRFFRNGFRQQTSLIETDISRRRARSGG